MSWIGLGFHEVENCELRKNICSTCPHTEVIRKIDKRDWEPPSLHRCHITPSSICKGSSITGMMDSQIDYKEDLEEL